MLLPPRWLWKPRSLVWTDPGARGRNGSRAGAARSSALTRTETFWVGGELKHAPEQRRRGGFFGIHPLFGGCKYTGAKCGLVDETCRSTRVSPHRCPSCLCQFHSPGTVITLEPFLEHSGGSKHGFHGNISVDKRIGAAVFL